MFETIAVFVAEDWFDIEPLRMWVKLQPKTALVLLTDDVTDANAALTRQMRCDGIVSAMIRTPSARRAPAEYAAAKVKRDQYMAAVATSVVDFGNVAGGPNRFAGKVAAVIKRPTGKL